MARWAAMGVVAGLYAVLAAASYAVRPRAMRDIGTETTRLGTDVG